MQQHHDHHYKPRHAKPDNVVRLNNCPLGDLHEAVERLHQRQSNWIHVRLEKLCGAKPHKVRIHEDEVTVPRDTLMTLITAAEAHHKHQATLGSGWPTWIHGEES